MAENYESINSSGLEIAKRHSLADSTKNDPNLESNIAKLSEERESRLLIYYVGMHCQKPFLRSVYERILSTDFKIKPADALYAIGRALHLKYCRIADGNPVENDYLTDLANQVNDDDVTADISEDAKRELFGSESEKAKKTEFDAPEFDFRDHRGRNLDSYL